MVNSLPASVFGEHEPYPAEERVVSCRLQQTEATADQTGLIRLNAAEQSTSSPSGVWFLKVVTEGRESYFSLSLLF